jgi:aspartate-semialdehyde dehydrogenase
MPRPASASPAAGGTRVAVVGAATAAGAKLREALARRGVPGGRVHLYGTERGEAVLGEYDGEARLIQEPDLDEIAGQDVVFLCEVSEVADRLLRPAGRKATVIDLTGRSPAGARARIVHGVLAPGTAEDRGGVLATPHPIAAILAEVLHPVQRSIGISEVVAVVVRPAADFGEPGVEELREQTVRLLRFEKAPREIFGRQLAFNVIPQRLLAGAEEGLERRIAREVATLLGWAEDRLAIRLMAAPVFTGHALSLRLKLARDAGAEALAEAIGADRKASRPRRGTAETPLAAPEERRTDVSEVVEDGIGGFWVWAIAGEAGGAAAEQAVLAAEAVVGW